MFKARRIARRGPLGDKNNMPDWTAPFYLPRMTTEKFRKMKAEYVAKHGYQITIPGFEDIIRLPVEKPLTAQEKILWRKRKYDQFSEERLEEIRYIKKRRKEKFLAMLASPSPEIFNNRGALLTALDDTQDAISTLAGIGVVAAKTLPRGLAKFIAGPTSWLMTGANLLNLAVESVSPERWGIKQKRAIDSLTDNNPKTKKLRLKTLDKLKRQRLHHGKLIEAAQVSENVFGAGISLGQLMNLPIEIIAGNIRMMMGHTVTVKYPIPDLGHWARMAARCSKGLLMSWTVPRKDDVLQDTIELVGMNLAAQVTRLTATQYNILDYADNIDIMQVAAPYPDNPMLIEVMDEEDPRWRETIGWPTIDRPWATFNYLYDSSVDLLNDNFKTYCERNARNWHGFIGAINATDGMFNAVEAVEGRDSVEYSYTAPCKTIHALLNQGYIFPPDISKQNQDKFGDWLLIHEKRGSSPTLPEALSYARNYCGFSFARYTPEL